MSRAVGQLEKIYNTLNADKFGGALPTPIITVQSKPGTYGHCSQSKIWRRKGGESLRKLTRMFEVTAGYLLGLEETANEPKRYGMNFRCYFPGTGNHTNHHCTMPLKDVERWVEAYQFTHPNIESITVKVWLKDFESVETKEK